MGTWGLKPWEDDSAADWFGSMFDATNLRQHVRYTLETANTDDDAPEIRAASAVLIMLGHTFIWPVDHLDGDLNLAVKRLEQIVSGPFAEELEFVEAINVEIAELRSRMQKKEQTASESEPPPNKKWWDFWK